MVSMEKKAYCILKKRNSGRGSLRRKCSESFFVSLFLFYCARDEISEVRERSFFVFFFFVYCQRERESDVCGLF